MCDGYYYDWDEASLACTDAGYDGLSSIRDETESQIMEDLMTSSGNNYSWLGYIEDSSGWYWLDGSTSTYTNWAPGEPNGDGDCGTIEGSTGYNWNDLDCSRTDPSGFICAMR